MCSLSDDPGVPKEDRHHELQKSHIKKSEATVLKGVSATQRFTNPWKIPDKKGLYSLSSGLPVSKDVENEYWVQKILGDH